MGLKIFLSFILFYIGTISYLTIFEKKFKQEEFAKNKTTPLLEFVDIKNYTITTKGIDTIIKAKKALRFQDHDEIKQVNILTFTRGEKETLKAKQANYKNDTIYLYGDIIYTKEDGTKLTSNRVVYEIKKKIITSKTPFVLITKKLKVTGNSFVYDKQKGIIKALKINALVREADKI